LEELEASHDFVSVKGDTMSNGEKRRTSRLDLGMLPALLVVLLFLVAALFADYLAPYDPEDINLERSFTPPYFQQGGMREHLLGTDLLGRDILSRLIHGARVSLIVAFLGVLTSGIIGGGLGILAGYRGGFGDTIISRSSDVMLGFPTILIALILAITIGPSLLVVCFIIVLVYWARYARQARGETLQIREMGYVTLARTAGCSNFIIMLRHILPNVMSSLLVLATFNVGTVITLESSLSFLGAGVPPPNVSWGSMCSEGRAYIVSAWWVSFMPGAAITLVVLSANLFGDWLRDKLDPRLRDL
jgi:peptide/nickel transport system permease protein